MTSKTPGRVGRPRHVRWPDVPPIRTDRDRAAHALWQEAVREAREADIKQLEDQP